MDKKFTSDEVPLSQILDQAASGELQLPDFQRGWVWDDAHIVSLLASISMSFPIGSVMTLETGNPDVRFKPRALEGVDLATPCEPDLLLLDGQQRTTSLYLALRSKKPVQTTDSKGRKLSRYYYADINACIDPDADREEDAIIGVDASKTVTSDFGRAVDLDLSTRELEIANEHFPMAIVLDPSGETMNWQIEYLQNGPGGPSAMSERTEKFKRFHETFLTPFVQYQVPAIQLAKSTPKEAVCQVFEKVNTGGVSLSVFELLTATYAADDFNLRDDWDARRSTFDTQQVLDRFEATDFLQVVTLLASFDHRQKHLETNPDSDKPPAVGCKRRDILRLSLDSYQAWADVAQDAVLRLVPFLHVEHVFKAQEVPYSTQFIPLAAVFAVLGDEADKVSTRRLLRQWYWCGVFGEMYGGATETRFANDLQDVVAWILHDGRTPRTVNDAQFQAERLLTLRSRASAAYKGLYALQLQRGAEDFRTGKAIDVHSYFDDNIDIHHIFPKQWCKANGIRQEHADCVVNKTAIDAVTNRRIGGKAPSVYLGTIEAKEGLQDVELDAILRSHDIEPSHLRDDDFEAFFGARFERMVLQIEEAMGKAANRAPDNSDNPYLESSLDPEKLNERVHHLIATHESKSVELKSTGRKNLKTGEADPRMEWGVLKTIAAFMNTHGGTLLIGVANDGGIVGIEADLPFVHDNDLDGWELWLTDLVKTAIGKVAAAELVISYCEIEEATIAVIDVGPSPEPVFADFKRQGKKDVFLVRTGNSTEELAGSDLLKYQSARWPG